MAKLYLYKCPANFNKGYSRVEIIEMNGNHSFTYESVTQSGEKRRVVRTLAKTYFNDSEFFRTEEEARASVLERMRIAILKKEVVLSRLKRKFEDFKNGWTT